MKKIIFASLLYATVLAALIAPLSMLAQVMIPTVDPNAPGTLRADSENPYWVQNQSIDGGIGADNPRASNFQIVPCNEGGFDPQTGKWKKGVECNFKAVVATFQRILTFLLYLSIPLVVGIILYTGFKYLTAGGDAYKLEEAKKMLIPVAIGIFWVLAAWLVVNTILKNFISSDTKTELQKNSEFRKLVE